MDAMRGWVSILSVLVVGGAAAASETYDNPGLGNAPCLVLNSYKTGAGRNDRFDAVASIENICGRSVEVALCFPYVEPVDDVDRQCFNGVVRPWAQSTVEISDLPVKLTGPDYQWRFLPVP